MQYFWLSLIVFSSFDYHHHWWTEQGLQLIRNYYNTCTRFYQSFYLSKAFREHSHLCYMLLCFHYIYSSDDLWPIWCPQLEKHGECLLGVHLLKRWMTDSSYVLSCNNVSITTHLITFSDFVSLTVPFEILFCSRHNFHFHAWEACNICYLPIGGRPAWNWGHWKWKHNCSCQAVHSLSPRFHMMVLLITQNHFISWWIISEL